MIQRVLMTTDTVGGVWTYALELARALYRHDIQVALATIGAHLNAPQRVEVRSILGLTVFESAFKLEATGCCNWRRLSSRTAST